MNATANEVRAMLDRFDAGRQRQPSVVWIRVVGGFTPAHSAGPGGYTPMGIKDLPTHVYLHGGQPEGKRQEILPVWANLGDQQGWLYPVDQFGSAAVSWGLTTETTNA